MIGVTSQAPHRSYRSHYFGRALAGGSPVADFRLMTWGMTHVRRRRREIRAMVDAGAQFVASDRTMDPVLLLQVVR